MTEGSGRASRALEWRWMPLLVTLLCAAGAIWIWHQFRSDEEARLARWTSMVAERQARSVELRTWQQIVALRPLARAGPRAAQTPPWTERVGALMQQDPSLEAVEWLEPVDAERATADAPARRDGAPGTIEGPIQLDGGRTGYRVLVPTGEAGAADTHVLRATYDANELLRAVTSAAPADLATSLSWNGTLVAQAGAPAAAGRWPEGIADAIHPAGATPWRLLVRPGEPLAASQRQRGAVAAAFLAAALVASAAVGALLASVRVARRRARSLFQTNAALAQILEQERAELQEQRAGRRSIEQEVAQRTREMRETVAELEAFNASVSHDLRSPIGAIVNFASLLRGTQGDRLDDDGRTFLKRIESAAQRALARMDGLLSFSRIGRRPCAPEEMDADAEVRGAFQRVGRRRSTRHIELALQALPRVTADPDLLRTVLEQLLDNAVKFSSTQEKPRIEVGWLRNGGTDAIVYFVRDNGVGFDPQFADRLFGLFERLHRQDEFEGAGVGLAVAARALRRLGGRIWAESAPGRGATFFFTLEDRGDDDRNLPLEGSAPGR